MPLFRKKQAGDTGPVGPAGPPGMDGVDGVDASDFLTLSENAGGSRAVTADGFLVDISDPNSLSRYTGITLQAGTTGEVIEVARSGLVTDTGWSWTPNEPIFITGLGVLTQTPPTGTQVRRIGWAMSPTTLNLDAYPSIKTVL